MGRASDYGTQQAQYNLLLLQLVTLPVEIPSWIDELTATCDDNLYVVNRCNSRKDTGFLIGSWYP